MDELLKELSEDWPSNPPSQHSSSLLQDTLSSKSTGSLSQIPRRTASNVPSSQGREQRRRPSQSSSNGRKEVLKERTSSSLNVLQKRQPDKPAKLKSPELASKQKHSRAPSTASTPSIPQGTVQFQASPTKEKNVHDTPEWKRRIVQGKIGAGDQTDMFGPMGLQSVFKPPTIASRTPQPKQKFQPQAANAPEMISSPPAGPFLSEHCSTSPPPDPINSPVMSAAQDNLNEDEEQDRGLVAHSQNYDDAGEDAFVNGSMPSPPVTRQHSSAHHTATSKAQPQPKGEDNCLSCNGSVQSRNEDFTPFYVSKSHTVDGRVDYAAIDASMKDLHSNMEKLRLQQQRIHRLRSDDHDQERSRTGTPGLDFRQSQINEITSESLPEDLSVGTDAFAAKGGFVSVRRGGYSSETSFQQRPLSPSPPSNIDGQSTDFTRASSQALPSPEVQRPLQQPQRRPSTPPKTPTKHGVSTDSSRERPRSSGSPLKLFDKYDTFTNNRLARHISRFEETFAQDGASEENEAGLQPSSPSPGPKIRKKVSQPQETVEDRPGRRISSFGEGELDEHEFYTDERKSHEAPSLPHWSLETRDSDTLPPRRRRRRKASRTGRPKRNFEEQDHQEWTSHSARLPSADENVLQRNQPTQEVSYTAHGKRLAYSPVKDPASKRRRTLCSSEERKRAILAAHPSQNDPEVKQTPLTSAHSRKRKDARYDNETQPADPNVIARRQILRPRNPTPSQTSSARQTPLIRVDEAIVRKSEHGRIQNDRTTSVAKVDPPTQIVAGALATIALNTVQGLESGSRKPSVTTSDFFNEAQQIMALIRQKRPQSSHTTAETSEAGHSIIPEESYTADSTKDEFSRPPSREGGSLRKLQAPAQRDARAVSHLRKFEDNDDFGLALPSSLRSLRTSHCELAAEDSPAGPINGELESEPESDPPNVRIRERLTEDQYREDTPSSASQIGMKAASGHQKTDSEGSSQSTGKSAQTGSSRSSVNMKKIAPQSVAHLLSDQMADMMFDKERQVWIKRKLSAGHADFDHEGHPTSEATEDNLFGDIPDLSVDEMEELRRVKDVVSSGDTLSLGGSATSKRDHAAQQDAPDDGSLPSRPLQDTRPTTADGKFIPPADDSSAPSKLSHFAWSGPMPGTRATSYGDDVWPEKEKAAQEQHRFRPTQRNGPAMTQTEEAEHEFSIFEGREAESPKQATSRQRQARVVTVAFSSPLIQSPYPQDDIEESNESRPDDTPSRSASRLYNSAKRPTSSGLSRGPRRASRRMSVGNSSFLARPMSRLDEQDEMSLVQYSAKSTKDALDMAVLTPLPLSRSLIVPPTTGQRSNMGFKLSPLPDFTIHQIDRALDAEEGAIVSKRHPRTSQVVSHALSLTAQELVKHLTDMEPYEPYWDHLASVNLNDRGLTSLHMLDEFCSRAQELDVSTNRIGDLDGAPRNVRSLNIRGNCLSDLTAWHTLLHLQYLDVSSNQLRSLKGFQGLVHLRGLKAEGNGIESLDGIERLDGLLSLSVRGNALRSVDFEGSNLKRLKKLDLSRNSLVHVASLYQLPALETCNLSMNDLEVLHFDAPITKLQNLDLSDNSFNAFNVSALPSLRKLILDGNAIVHLDGLENHKHLETLSWREQDIISNSEIQYQCCHEMRSLYLSSTSLTSFAPKTPFLNLNTLELASTGLQTLPEDFGLVCRNLRALNLNYNAIHDIRPLLSIERLQHLYLAGNRLSRLRRTAAVLDRLSDDLMELDLRNNPLTVGFYTPQIPAGNEEMRVVVHEQTQTHSTDEEEGHQTRSAQLHLLPLLDKDADTSARERLDEDTKLRRRVYEMLLVHACKSIKRLDGLEVDRAAVGRRDGVWERLLELEVLKGR